MHKSCLRHSSFTLSCIAARPGPSRPRYGECPVAGANPVQRDCRAAPRSRAYRSSSMTCPTRLARLADARCLLACAALLPAPAGALEAEVADPAPLAGASIDVLTYHYDGLRTG